MGTSGYVRRPTVGSLLAEGQEMEDMETFRNCFCKHCVLWYVDDEWNSSLEYYEELYQEAELSLQFALEELYNIYKNEIADNLWHINFKSCEIVIGSTYSEYPAIKEETYNDQLRRLYPIDSYESLSINDSSAKDITLQVTDACNMACTYCYQHNKGKHSMSFDTAKAFIDMILDADERSISYIKSMFIYKFFMCSCEWF